MISSHESFPIFIFFPFLILLVSYAIKKLCPWIFNTSVYDISRTGFHFRRYPGYMINWIYINRPYSWMMWISIFFKRFFYWTLFNFLFKSSTCSFQHFFSKLDTLSIISMNSVSTQNRLSFFSQISTTPTNPVFIVEWETISRTLFCIINRFSRQPNESRAESSRANHSIHYLGKLWFWNMAIHIISLKTSTTNSDTCYS